MGTLECRACKVERQLNGPAAVGEERLGPEDSRGEREAGEVAVLAVQRKRLVKEAFKDTLLEDIVCRGRQWQ